MSGFPTVNFSDTDEGLFTPEEIGHLMRVEYDRAKRYEYPAAVMMIEVDRLEYLQDLYGWESKEEILRTVVRLLRSTTRDSDFLGCMQASRILVVFPHADEKTAVAIAGRLLKVCRDLDFRTDGRSLRATLSIGIATLRPDGDEDFESFVRNAEEGVAFAVESGGDRFVRRESAADMIQELRQDLESQEQRLDEAAAASIRELDERLRALFVDPKWNASAEVLQEEVVRVATSALKNAERRTSGHEAEIDKLHRRVGKLKELLDASEAELTSLAKVKGVEPGVASIYRTVQGLRGDETQFDAKKEMLTLIFQANLDLQKKRRGES